LLIPNPIPKKVLHQKKGMKIYMEMKEIRKITKTKILQQTNREMTKSNKNLLEVESDQDGGEELGKEEVQEEDSSDAEEEEDDSIDAGEVEEGNEEEDEIEDVEEPESIVN
jgi:hypothetical protein